MVCERADQHSLAGNDTTGQVTFWGSDALTILQSSTSTGLAGTLLRLSLPNLADSVACSKHWNAVNNPSTLRRRLRNWAPRFHHRPPHWHRKLRSNAYRIAQDGSAGLGRSFDRSARWDLRWGCLRFPPHRRRRRLPLEQGESLSLRLQPVVLLTLAPRPRLEALSLPPLTLPSATRARCSRASRCTKGRVGFTRGERCTRVGSTREEWRLRASLPRVAMSPVRTSERSTGSTTSLSTARLLGRSLYLKSSYSAAAALWKEPRVPRGLGYSPRTPCPFRALFSFRSSPLPTFYVVKPSDQSIESSSSAPASPTRGVPSAFAMRAPNFHCTCSKACCAGICSSWRFWILVLLLSISSIYAALGGGIWYYVDAELDSAIGNGWLLIVRGKLRHIRDEVDAIKVFSWYSAASPSSLGVRPIPPRLVLSLTILSARRGDLEMEDGALGLRGLCRSPDGLQRVLDVREARLTARNCFLRRIFLVSLPPPLPLFPTHATTPQLHHWEKRRMQSDDRRVFRCTSPPSLRARTEAEVPSSTSTTSVLLPSPPNAS